MLNKYSHAIQTSYSKMILKAFEILELVFQKLLTLVNTEQVTLHL